MAKIFIPTRLKELTGGQIEVRAKDTTVHQIIQDLDRQFPDAGRLQPNISVAIDGEVSR